MPPERKGITIGPDLQLFTEPDGRVWHSPTNLSLDAVEHRLIHWLKENPDSPRHADVEQWLDWLDPQQEARERRQRELEREALASLEKNLRDALFVVKRGKGISREQAIAEAKKEAAEKAHLLLL